MMEVEGEKEGESERERGNNTFSHNMRIMKVTPEHFTNLQCCSRAIFHHFIKFNLTTCEQLSCNIHLVHITVFDTQDYIKFHPSCIYKTIFMLMY